jgi:arylsulfatase B
VNPLCAPTRATIITGKYGEQTGVLNVQDQSTLALDEVTVFEYLEQVNSGYATGLIGKWHLGGQTSTATDPNDQGVPHYSGLLAGGVQNYSNWMQTTNGAQTTNTDYISRVLTDSAVAWIGRQTQPWFCWLAHVAPHVPFHRPPLFMHTQGPLPTHPDSIDANPQPYFMAMMESLDFELGRMMDSLGNDVLANTVIIFIGDNGTDGEVIQAPYGPGHAKNSLYEGGVRVPLVIAGPAVTRAGEREPALVNGTDLFTTLVELTGSALPQFEDSKSLVPLLTQAGLQHRDCLRSEVSGQLSGGYAIRNERYKVIVRMNGDQEFYDLDVDPYESQDLMLGTLTSDEELALDELLNGCQVSTSIAVRDTPTFMVYPVPTSDELFVQGADERPYQLFSADGVLARTGVVRSGGIEIHDLSPGLYSLVMDHQRAVFVKIGR